MLTNDVVSFEQPGPELLPIPGMENVSEALMCELFFGGKQTLYEKLN